MKYFALSFDLEEFDIPLEFNQNIIKDEMLNISYKGTKNLLNILEKHNIKATFFVTKEFYQKYPKLINNLSKTHEIALHGEHDKNYRELSREESLKSLKETKETIEKGIKKKILGFRAPRMMPPSYEILKEIGITYDSSLHPTIVPGRYNNFLMPRKPYEKLGIKIIPVSVIPLIRAPIVWLFRNFPLIYSKTCTNLCYLTDKHVNIYFHPWEFTDIKNYKIPLIMKYKTGKPLINKLDKYLSWLKRKKVKFITLKEIN